MFSQFTVVDRQRILFQYFSSWLLVLCFIVISIRRIILLFVLLMSLKNRIWLRSLTCKIFVDKVRTVYANEDVTSEFWWIILKLRSFRWSSRYNFDPVDGWFPPNSGFSDGGGLVLLPKFLWVPLSGVTRQQLIHGIFQAFVDVEIIKWSGASKRFNILLSLVINMHYWMICKLIMVYITLLLVRISGFGINIGYL